MGEKSPFRVATREELLARGYVLSLAELKLPSSPELDQIISILQTQRGPVALAIWFQSANGWVVPGLWMLCDGSAREQWPTFCMLHAARSRP